MIEIWKDIPDYEGLYEINNFGIVRSLDRVVKQSYGKTKSIKGNLKTLIVDRAGYLVLRLSKNGKNKTHYLHRLLFRTFKGEIPEGYVVDHKDNNRLNNDLDNLQAISKRKNSSKDKKEGTSKYTGVSWCKKLQKWKAGIRINKKSVHLGYYKKEEDARDAYINKIKEIEL